MGCRPSGSACSTASRSPPASVALLSEDLNHVAQVAGGAGGTKITNTGTNSGGGLVDIRARSLRPSVFEGLDASLAQVESATTEITVSDPGKARIYVRDPPVTVKCYGADATVNSIFNCVG